MSMGFSKQEYWSGLPCPPPGDLHDPGIKPSSLLSPPLAGGFFTTSTTWEAHIYTIRHKMTNENLLYSTGNSLMLHDNLNGKGIQGGRYSRFTSVYSRN